MNKIQKKLERWKVEREVDEHNESCAYREGYVKAMCDAINLVKNLTIPDVINWVAYDFRVQLSHPPQYGKYLICRKDGKIHWETWNGSGWAYNHTVIRYWAELIPPCL